MNNATAPVNIVLANSITTNNFVIPEDKDVTLDLNGRTVTNAESHTILNKGHLTLKDSSADKAVRSSPSRATLQHFATEIMQSV